DHDEISSNGPTNVNGGDANWWAKLAPYYPVKWTNAAYHCPAYRGVVASGFDPGSTRNAAFGSYAYNGFGVFQAGWGRGPKNPNLGLGPPRRLAGFSQPLSSAHEVRVMVPSDMLAVADSRFLSPKINGEPGGYDLLECGLTWLGPINRSAFDSSRHGRTYNV